MDGFAIIAHSTPTLYFLASGLPGPSSEVRETEAGAGNQRQY